LLKFNNLNYRLSSNPPYQTVIPTARINRQSDLRYRAQF